MIQFKQDYKQRVYDVLKDDSRIAVIMQYLEENRDTDFRTCLEEILDEYRDKLRPKVINDEAEWEIWNSLSNKYLEIESLETTLMDSLIQDLVQEIKDEE